jgi:DNA helicase II / ATP-dependent DNA helicase PcrA
VRPGSPLTRVGELGTDAPISAREELAGLAGALADCAAQSPEDHPVLPPAGQIERIRRFYEPLVHRMYRSPGARSRDLEQLERIAARFPTRQRFLSELTFDPPASTADLAGPPHLDEDFLILSTMHSAKGCEWDAVHVIHAADGNIPSDLSTGDVEKVEEERRLFYVALTRARDALHVFFPLRYYHRRHERGDAHSYAQLTRFLPDEVRGLFDEGAISANDEAAVDPSLPIPGGVGRAVDEVLSALWGLGE